MQGLHISSIAILENIGSQAYFVVQIGFFAGRVPCSTIVIFRGPATYRKYACRTGTHRADLFLYVRCTLLGALPGTLLQVLEFSLVLGLLAEGCCHLQKRRAQKDQRKHHQKQFRISCDVPPGTGNSIGSKLAGCD